ncbi:hypothetical protein P7C71_g6221, partial [Lecanoromycetidae sp. Uapishka_2]
MSIPSNSVYPADGTWFDTLHKSFVDVPVNAQNDNAISTSDFLEAAESLTTLFGGLRISVRDRQLASPADSETLQSLVVNELKTKKKVAAEGLLWLVRGLDFTAQAIRHNVSHPSEELSVSFRHAYGNTLKPHHSFMVKPIFSAAMSATPYRKDFYSKLGDDMGKVNSTAETWLEALEKQVGILKQFQGRKEAKW